MSNAITTNITLPMKAIRAYCEKWGVVEFALFDLVTMSDELEAIFGRKVDLFTCKGVEQSLKNAAQRQTFRSYAIAWERFLSDTGVDGL